TYLGNRKREAFGIRLDETAAADPTFSTDGLAKSSGGDRLSKRQIESRKGITDGFVVPGEDGSMVVASTASLEGTLKVRLSRFEGGSGERWQCGGRPATVQGTSGDDTLIAGEVTVTGEGDDRVKGAGRMLCTGPGDDSVKSGRGGKVNLGPGNDRAKVRSGDIVAGAGHDRVEVSSGWGITVRGGKGNDRLRVNGERTVVHGDAGNDHIRNDSERTAGSEYFGGPGRDRIVGGDGPETLRGGPGSDFLSGGGGPDTLFGDRGRDRLLGGTGSDRLVGGPGRDRLDAGPKGPPLQIYGIRNRRIKGDLKVLRNGVVASSVRVKTRCNGTTDDHFVDAGLREVKFRADGRFELELDFFDGFGFTSYGWVKGRKTNRMTLVRFWQNDDFSYGSDGSYHCRTGNVKFRLKRRADEVQKAIQ
ncbi:MAG: hypothetical protein M3Y23_03470, partial [Actinomycetota bacterium]|nr:hypothetical protein [Actinomycetota bacterium]